MRIAVLDGYALNPGDLSWKALQDLGECDFFDRTSPGEIVSRSADAGAIVTNKVMLDAAVLARLPGLRYIGVTATGYNVVDMAAARARRIVVTNVPAYGTDSVAQMTFALLLELVLHAGDHSRAVREGRWTASRDFCFWETPLVELNGLVMGLVGFGQIGRAVARMALAFGMNVRVYVRTPRDLPPGVVAVDLDTLFRESDVVSLHCPLSEDNAGFVNAARLALMKPSAFLLNTARGHLVNEADLAAALNGGRLAGAGEDVLSVEPPRRDNPLLTARNCVITPHIAWATRAARQRLMDVVVANLKSFLDGQPRNVVS